MAIARDMGARRSIQQAPPPTTTTGTIPTQPEDQQGPISIQDALDELMGGAGGTVYGPTPIGVQPGFQVRPWGGVRPYGVGTGNIEPRYFADDDYLPANYTPSVIAKMQRDMASVGLFDANATLISGDWGEESATAFRRLLAYANQHGMSWTVAIGHLRSQLQNAAPTGAATMAGAGGRFRIDRNGNLVDINAPTEREPLVIQQTDPRTVNILLRELSMNLLGQALSPDQIADMTAAYNQMELQRQQEAYNAQVTGGTVLNIPSPEAYGQAQIEQQFPEQVATNTGMNYLSEAMRMLGSPAWGI